MIADGLIKALSPQRHEAFVKLIKLDDIMERIELKKRMEALRDQLQARKAAAESPGKATEMIFLVSRGVKTRGIGLHLHLDIQLYEIVQLRGCVRMNGQLDELYAVVKSTNQALQNRGKQRCKHRSKTADFSLLELTEYNLFSPMNPYYYHQYNLTARQNPRFLR